LIKKHSEFINYPISLYVEKTVSKEVDVEEEVSDTKEGEGEEVGDSDEPKIDEISDEDLANKVKNTKTVEEVVSEYVLLNKQKPVWTKKPDSVSKDEYASFYKSLTNDSRTSSFGNSPSAPTKMLTPPIDAINIIIISLLDIEPFI
jgi:molecular chaperone HtpG